MSGTLFLNVNNIQYMIPEDQKKYTTMKYGVTFYSRQMNVENQERSM